MPIDGKRLFKAATLIEREMQMLDTRDSICPCCGLNKQANWTEWQAHRELEAVVRKLRAQAAAASR